jgi:Na+-transporting methylmalonyl-CoA/oxaloacetate decarboxylase gamma subunit
MLLYSIDTQALKFSAELLWKGMLAIFLVMALLFVAILIINKITNTPKEKWDAAKDRIVGVFKKDKDLPKE